MGRIGRAVAGEAGQAMTELLLTVALAAALVTLAVVTLAPPFIVLVVVVVNYMAVFLTSSR